MCMCIDTWSTIYVCTQLCIYDYTGGSGGVAEEPEPKPQNKKERRRERKRLAAAEREANLSPEDDPEKYMGCRVQQKNQELAAAEEEVEAERAPRGSGVTGGAAVAAAPATATAGATGSGRGAKGKGKGDKKERAALEVCAHCGTEKSATNPLSRCSRCRLVWYGKDRGCQRAAWPSHKKECRSVAAQAATDPVEELLREHAPSDFSRGNGLSGRPRGARWPRMAGPSGRKPALGGKTADNGGLLARGAGQPKVTAGYPYPTGHGLKFDHSRRNAPRLGF